MKNWLHNELFERVPSNIAIIDRQYRIIEANRNYTREFGEWNKKPCYEVYRGRKSPCSSCKAELVFADGSTQISEEKRLNRKGRYSYYVVHFEPIVDSNGDIPYVIEMSQDVTERRQLQREYDILFDRVPCYVVVLDRDLNVVRNNELFRRKFGESIGKKCYKVYQNHDKPCATCPAMATFEDGQMHVAAKKGVGKNGEIIHYHVTTAALSRGEGEPTHVIEMSLDVTETNILETQLKENYDFQESLIQSAIDGIIAVDADGEINIFNPSAEKLFKVQANEVIGRSMLDKFAPRKFIDIIADEGSSCVMSETTVNDWEGDPFPVRFSGRVLKSGDKYLGSAGYFQDLSDIKKLETEKLEAERLAAVGETVAGLAHGLKNVLMALKGGMYVVNSGMKKDDKELTRRGWDMLQNNIERITTYVKDFLNFAKGHKPEVDLVEPNSVAREVFDLYKDMAAQEGITLTSDFQEDIAPMNMDREGLHTCLANLVSNAIDACEMSDNKDCGVQMRTLERDGTIIFQVEDDGCGMDYEVKKKVFTTFFSTKESSKGTGLGLLVTRRITQEHGGRVTLDSTEGEGSIFRLEFSRDRLPQINQI